MPSANRFIINIRSTPEYERALLRLVRAEIKAGTPIEPGEFNRLVEILIAERAASRNIKLPPRMPPPGTNRYGQPKTKGDKP